MQLPSTEVVRLILGLKVRRQRITRGLALKELSKRTGLSISYLSEIEKGRKYPKPDKLLQLASALGVDYDDLVSLEMDGELRPLRELFESPFIREFPFHVYGLEMGSLLGLLTEAPSKAGAMVHTALEIGRLYDLEVEHFLLAALRSYQFLRHNYFADIEDSASALRQELGLEPGEVPEVEPLRRRLEVEHGFTIDLEQLAATEELRHLRAVWKAGEPPHLFLNGQLRDSQQAFMLGRELGYLRLGLKERSVTSPALGIHSFDQVIQDFEAAYFSGALLLDRETLVPELEHFFRAPRFSESTFLGFLENYRTTPETFFYRLSQLLPSQLGLGDLFFLRFSQRPGDEGPRLTKMLNLSPLVIPYGLELQEHYCRRWTGLAALEPEPAKTSSDGVTVRIQRSRFLEDSEYLVFTLGRALSLAPETRTSVSLGLRLDGRSRRRVRFFEDDAIPQRDVHLTCERCPLEDCRERAAEPAEVRSAARRKRRERALERLLES